MPQTAAEIIKSEVTDGAHIWTVARRHGADGTAILRADVTSWTLNVYKRGPGDSLAPDTPIYSVAATLASATAHASESDAFNEDVTAALFTSLQTDGYWANEDSTGYSFRHRLKYGKISGTMEGAESLRLEFVLNTPDFGFVPITHEARVLPLRTH